MTLPRPSSAFLLHASGWILLSLMFSASSIFVLYHLPRWPYIFWTQAMGIPAVYMCLYLYRHLPWNKWLNTGLILGLASLWSLITYFSVNFFYLPTDKLFSTYLILRNMVGFYFILVVFFSLDVLLIRNREKMKQSLLQEQLLKTELLALRRMVHPHFLLNTLNNIYSLVHFQDPRAGEAIMHLSDLLRHLLIAQDQDKIPLTKEMEWISHYIELNRLKFDRGQIDFEILGNLGNKEIPPFLLIHLTENCFSHSHLAFDPLGYVRIKAQLLDNGSLRFETRNSIIHPDEEQCRHWNLHPREGLGLKNLQATLDKAYPHKYLLQIIPSQHEFHCCLEVIL